MAEDAEHKELRSELARARAALAIYGSAIRHDLDFGAKIKRGVTSNPIGWFGAATFLGFLLSAISPMGRKRKVRAEILPSGKREKAAGQGIKAAIGLAVLKFALDLAKPAMLGWFKKNYLEQRREPGSDARVRERRRLLRQGSPGDRGSAA